MSSGICRAAVLRSRSLGSSLHETLNPSIEWIATGKQVSVAHSKR